MMSSSSCSSSGDCAFSLREADEEGPDSSELEEDACSDDAEQQEVDSEDLDACMASEQQHQVAQLQPQQQRPCAPSRLAMCSSMGAEEGAAAAKAAVPAGAVAAAKSSSSDLASVMSEGTVFNLATAMSLGSNAARVPGDADLLFDLEDEPAGAGSGSSGGGTPRGSVLRSLHAKGQLGSISGRQDDVVMAGASPPGLYGARSISDMEAEQLTEYLGSARLLPPGTAAAAPGSAAAGVDGRGRLGLSVALSSPMPAGTAGLPPTPPGVLPSPAGLPPIARSVQLGENWMLQGLKAKAAQAVHARCTMTGSKKSAAAAAAARRRNGVQRVMYPAPVVRAAPRKSNEVLSGLSEEQWVAFVAELQAYMDDALRPATGSWRRAYAATGCGAAAMSCPRF
jgi:hypothetical protein